MGSYSDSNSSQYFARNGTNVQTSATDMDPFFTSLMRKNVTDGDTPTQLVTDSNAFLSGLMNRNNAVAPSKAYADTALNDVTPNDFAGRANLLTQANRDPFSTAYETATSAKYSDRVNQGLAQLSTGPDNVRGGTARNALSKGEAINRMALERSDEIRRSQLQDAGIQQQASNMLNAIESGRRATLLQGQGQLAQQFFSGAGQGLQGVGEVGKKVANTAGTASMVSKLMGTAVQRVFEAMSGYGSGTSSGFNAGVNCCFVFLEAYDGQLPWFVRKARDIFYDEKPIRRIGYVRMSKWLVPAMRRWPIIKNLVRAILIKPLSKYGAWFFADESAKPHWKLYKLYVRAWFKIWELGGRI